MGRACTHRVSKPRRLEGSVAVPGDKSISHRALILNGIARGEARIDNLLLSKDCLSTLGCLRQLGVAIDLERCSPAAGVAAVRGAGLGGLQEPAQVLDAGNSGTTIRLLCGVAAGQPFLTIFTGDDSLRRRPMGRVIEPLIAMGAGIWARGDGKYPPVAVRGGHLEGFSYELPVASAQVKSALLLAGLWAGGTTRLTGLIASRDHTERLLGAMGAAIRRTEREITIEGGREITSRDIVVPGDISSAAYWLVAGIVHPDSRVTVTGVGINPTRTGIIDALRQMGYVVAVSNKRLSGGEPVADLCVESGDLHGTTIEGAIIPRLIDEIPILAVAACAATGTTAIREAAELRVKETDRIAYLCRELSRLGAKVEELPDGLLIHGPCDLRGTAVCSHGDHRLAMALAVAGLIAGGETVVEEADAVDVSYPGFWSELEGLAG